jgi:hypothetical protein
MVVAEAAEAAGVKQAARTAQLEAVKQQLKSEQESRSNQVHLHAYRQPSGTLICDALRCSGNSGCVWGAGCNDARRAGPHVGPHGRGPHGYCDARPSKAQAMRMFQKALLTDRMTR